jgi:hypothetical protein
VGDPPERYDLLRLGARRFAELCGLLLRSDLDWGERRRRRLLLAAAEVGRIGPAGRATRPRPARPAGAGRRSSQPTSSRRLS